MNARKAYRRFADAIIAAGDGADLTVGLTYDVKGGWMVFLLVGTTLMSLPPAEARKLGDHMLAKMPAGQMPELRDIMKELVKLCDEADQKNAGKVVPEGYAEMMPVEGRA